MLTSPEHKLTQIMEALPRAEINLGVKLQGRYGLTVRRHGEVVQELEFDNLILNQGRDKLGTGSLGASVGITQYAQIGTGTSTPVATQTQLDAYTAGVVNSSGSQTYSNSGAPNYTWTQTYVYAFAQGAVVGNMSEVGVGWTQTNGNLFSRARILDGSLNPTTITLTSIDQLTISYSLTFVPVTTGVPGTVTLEGTPYTYTAYLTNAVNSGGGPLTYLSVSSNQPWGGFAKNDLSQLALYLFPAGTTVGTPLTNTSLPPNSTGAQNINASSSGSPSTYSYTAGSYACTTTMVVQPSAGNFVGGIQGFYAYLWLSVGGGGTANYRIYFYFDTPIPKTNTKSFTIALTFSWA